MTFSDDPSNDATDFSSMPAYSELGSELPPPRRWRRLGFFVEAFAFTIGGALGGGVLLLAVGLVGALTLLIQGEDLTTATEGFSQVLALGVLIAAGVGLYIDVRRGFADLLHDRD